MTNTDNIANLLIEAGEPDKDNSTAVVIYTGTSLGTSSDTFTGLLDDLTGKVTKSNKKEIQNEHRRCLNHVLNSLIQCMFRFEWLSLPTNSPNFNAGEYLNRLGFSRRIMGRIIELLCAEDVMYLGIKGYRDARPGAVSKASQFYPTEKFIKLFSSSLYSTFGDFDDYDALKFERFDDVDMPSATSTEEWNKIIMNYNSFMRDHSWAMKNPSSRSLKDFIGRSGRINNYYQNLANRRITLRTSTLIDGEAIAEPDFSCNHLRMASYLVGEELPDDPYDYIAKDTELSRDKIKAVITRVFGATTTQAKGNLIGEAHKHRKVKMSADDFRAVLSSLEKNYPWVVDKKLIFNDVGTRMQWLEGEIGLEMLKWSTDNQLPLLAVHDGYAVRSSDEAITYDYMQSVWKEVVEKAKKSKFIEATQYTVDVVRHRKKGGG